MTLPFQTAVAARARVRQAKDLSLDLFLDVIDEQGRQGVGCFTLHAGLLWHYLPLAAGRRAGIASRGGAILAEWMMVNRRQNFLYTRFDDVLAAMRRHDATVSLGAALRPGCPADASDRAQLAELETLAELIPRCRDAGVAVILERHALDETLPEEAFRTAEFCSMCGPKFCSMQP